MPMPCLVLPNQPSHVLFLFPAAPGIGQLWCYVLPAVPLSGFANVVAGGCLAMAFRVAGSLAQSLSGRRRQGRVLARLWACAACSL